MLINRSMCLENKLTDKKQITFENAIIWHYFEIENITLNLTIRNAQKSQKKIR